MKKLKSYFAQWDFTRYFRLIMGLLLLVGFFSTKENMYLVASLFLTAQAVLNFGCPGGACTTKDTKSDDAQVMEFKKYEPGKGVEKDV